MKLFKLLLYDPIITVKLMLSAFDSLCPSQQFFSYVETGLPGLNQY